MAVSSTTNRVSFDGNGTTQMFGFPYYTIALADLKVILVKVGGAQVPLVYNTDFTVVGFQQNGVYPGGVGLVLQVAPLVGEKLIIYRDPAATQDLQIGENDPFPAKEIEKSLDKLTLLMQRALDRANRAVALSDGFTGVFDGTLPTAPEANRMLMVNATGTGFALGPTPQELSDAATAVTGTIASATAAAASATAAAGSQTAAGISAAGANSSKITAERWASLAAGTVVDAGTGVDSGLYSARKYATDAASSATGAATSATNAATSAAAAAQSAADAASAAGGGVTSLTGDVAGVGPGAATTTIQPGVVTMAKLATAVQTTITGKSPQLNDTGTGTSIVADAATGKVKKLVAGTNITITPGADGITIDSTASAGVVDHGALTGLADDDHTQYHNDARGDARYFTQAQVTTALAAKSATLNDTGTGESIISAAATGKLKKLIAGSNVTLTAGADGLTIASTGGGGGGAPDVSTATGTLAISHGGTGQTTQQAALNALTGTQTAGRYLRSDGTNAALSAIQAADVPVLNQNTTGTAANVTGTVAIGNGGTGQTTASAAINALVPAQSGNIGRFLKTDGSAVSWAVVAGVTPNLITASSSTAAPFPALGYQDLGSITLPAGDYDIEAQATLTNTGSSAPSQLFTLFVGTTAGNNTTGLAYGLNAATAPTGGAGTGWSCTPTVSRYNVKPTSSTTYYLKVAPSNAITQVSISGYRITARQFG